MFSVQTFIQLYYRIYILHIYLLWTVKFLFYIGNEIYRYVFSFDVLFNSFVAYQQNCLPIKFSHSTYAYFTHTFTHSSYCIMVNEMIFIDSKQINYWNGIDKLPSKGYNERSTLLLLLLLFYNLYWLYLH